MCPEGEVRSSTLQGQSLKNKNIPQYADIYSKRKVKVVESIFCNPANWDLLFNDFKLQVFDHDWFAVPFVMTTCQVSLQ